MLSCTWLKCSVSSCSLSFVTETSACSYLKNFFMSTKNKEALSVEPRLGFSIDFSVEVYGHLHIVGAYVEYSDDC